MAPAAATTLWPNLQVHRISDALNNDQHLIFQGSATPDGHYLLAKIQTRWDFGYGPNNPEQVALYNPTTGSTQVIFTASDTRHGVTGIVADDHWVVWYEIGLPELSTDSSWTLYAYNIDTTTTKTIEHNDGSGGVAYPTPQIDQGQLIWDDTTGAVTLDKSNYVIKLMDLSSGATRTLAQKAANPVISWPWVGWSQVTSTDPSHVQGDEQFTNLQTSESVAVPVMAGEKVLVGTSLVYTTSSSNSNYFTYVPDIHHPVVGVQVFDPIGALTITNLSFNGRYVAWHSLGTRDLPAIYDVQHRQLISFPVQYRPIITEYAFIAATYLVWSEDPNSDAQETDYQNQHQAPPLIFSIVDLGTL